MQFSYQNINKVFSPQLDKLQEQIYRQFLDLNEPIIELLQMEISQIEGETQVNEIALTSTLPETEPIQLFQFQKIQAGIPITGTVTEFFIKDKLMFLGTSEGVVQILCHHQNKIEIIQPVSPSDQEANILKQMTSLITFGSANPQPKRSMLQNLVNVTYDKQTPKLAAQKDYTICSISISEDKEVIAIGNNLGEVHLFKNAVGFASLEVIQLQKPQKFLCFYAQNYEEGTLRTLETQVYDFYELLCGDEYGNVNKVCINMFKIFDKRTMQYKIFQIYQQSLNPEQFQNSRRAWWEIKQEEMEIQQNLKVILYDVKNIINRSNTTFQYVLFLFETRFEIVKIHIGKTPLQPTNSFIESVFYFERPPTELLISRYNILNKESQVSISFGGSCITFGQGKLREQQGTKKNSSQDLETDEVICINWGSTFCFFTSKISSEEVSMQYGPLMIISQATISGYTDANDHSGELPSVLHVELVSENILWVVMSDFYGALLHLDEFMTSIELSIAQVASAYVRTLTLKELEKYFISRPMKNYLNNYQLASKIRIQVVDSTTKSLYFIDQNCNILKTHLIDWKSYINQRLLQRNWSLAIADALKVQNRELNILSCIPSNQSKLQEQIREFAPVIAKGFVLDLVAQKSDPKRQKETLKYLDLYIDYLLYTKNADVIFDQVREILCDNNLRDVYYEHFLSFVAQGKIKYVPSDSLLIIYQQLKKTGSQKQIINLIQHLDPKRVSQALLMKMCEEQNLRGYLVYVCNENNDYITPIQKLLPMDLDEDANDPSVKGIIQYVMMCLKRQKINGKYVFNVWNRLLDSCEEDYKLPLYIGPYSYILKDRPSSWSKCSLPTVLQEYHRNHLVSEPIHPNRIELESDQLCFNYPIRLIFPQPSSYYYIIDIESLQKNVLNKVFILIVAIYEELMVHNPKKFNPLFYYLFILKCALSRTFKLQNDFHFRALKYLIDKYDSLIELQNCDQFLKKQTDRNVWIVINEFFIQQLNLYFQGSVSGSEIIQLVILSEDKYSVRNQSLILCYLYTINNNHKKCFEYWLSIPNPTLRNQIFDWLGIIFQTKESEIIYDEFIIEGIKSLLKVNKQLTYNFVQHSLKDKQNKIIESLDNDDTAIEFLQYLTHIFDIKDKTLIISDQTKIRYVKYMCLYKPKSVLPTLKIYVFPLTQCLSVCQEHNAFHACVYILAELGDQKSSLEYLILIFLLKIRKSIRSLLLQYSIDKKKLSVINNLFQQIIGICKNTQLEYESTNGLWYFFLDLFLKECKIRTFTSLTVPQLIKRFLADIVSEFFTAMAYNMTPLQLISVSNQLIHIIKILETQYVNLPLYIFAQTFLTSQYIVDYDKQSFYFGKRLYQIQNTTTINSIYKISSRGIYQNGTCDYCLNVMFDDQSATVFLCRHIFHKRCCSIGIFQTPYCRVCYDYLKYQINYEKDFAVFSRSRRIADTLGVKKHLQLYEFQKETKNYKKNELERKQLLVQFDQKRKFSNYFIQQAMDGK